MEFTRLYLGQKVLWGNRKWREIWRIVNVVIMGRGVLDTIYIPDYQQVTQ